MKARYIRLWLIGLTIVMLVFSSVLYAESRGLTTYTNKKYNFKIGYPSGWQITENYMNAEAIFLSQSENANDKFRENVNIVVVNLPANTGLEIVKNSTVNQLRSYVKNFNLEAEKAVTWAGQDAYAIVYTGILNNCKLRWQQILTVKNEHAFVLTYTAEETSYTKFFPFFNQIAASFTFK